VWVLSAFFLRMIEFFARTLVVLVLLVGAFLLGVSVGEGPSELSTSSDPVESQIAYIKSQVDSLQTSVRSSLPAKIEEGCALAKAQGYDLCATVRPLRAEFTQEMSRS
jgi:hypothetical protein